MYANWLFSSFERRFVHSVGDNLQSYLPKKKRANLSLAFSIYLRVPGNLLCSNLTNSQKNSSLCENKHLISVVFEFLLVFLCSCFKRVQVLVKTFLSP